jgi:hypothetical protein
VQVEFVRWTISTGQPALTGYNKVPPRLGPTGKVNVLWTVMGLSKSLQIGGWLAAWLSLSVCFTLRWRPA